MPYLQKLIYVFILYLTFSSYSYSHIVIDVDECVLPSLRGIRIAEFNTEAQKFQYVSYIPSSSFHQGEWLPGQRGISYNYLGNFLLPDNFDLKDFIIRTRGKNLIGGPQTQEAVSRIYSKLQKFSANPAGNLQVIMNGINWTEEQMPEEEKKRLGELATELTFLSFGYAKLPSNHGLDGVYVDNFVRPVDLFLTESKYRDEGKTAETYMNEELNEEEICRKAGVAHPETQRIVRDFLEHKPFGIHKLVHRMNGGAAQICVQAFDQRSYRGFLLKNPTSSFSEEDIIAILKDMLDRMNTPLQNSQEIIRTFEVKAKVKFNHALDEDARELLEAELGALSPREVKEIKDKLKEIPEDRRQMVFDVVFRYILGDAELSSYASEPEILLSTIGAISHSLAAIPVEQLVHVNPVADGIFCSSYSGVDPDHFELEDRLSLFHSFFNSTHGHHLDKANREVLLYVYHMIYDSFRTMEIEPEKTLEPVYLANFVETFRNLADNDLKDLCRTIAGIYDTKRYSYLKGSHECEDWELLAESLRNLNAEQRKKLSDFFKLVTKHI